MTGVHKLPYKSVPATRVGVLKCWWICSMHEPSRVGSTLDLRRAKLAEPATARPFNTRGGAMYLLRTEICLHSLYQLLSVGLTIRK